MADVKCPKCRAEFTVDFEPGTEFECGACDAVVVVPEPTAKPAARPAGRTAAASRRPAAPTSAKKGPPLPLLVGGGAVIVLAAFFLLAGGDDDKPAPPEPASVTAVPPKPVEPAKPVRPSDPFEAARFDAAQPGASTEVVMTFADMAWEKAEAAAKDGNTSAESRFRSEAGEAYASILKKNGDDAKARERLGFVRFDREAANAALAEPWMTKSLRSGVEEVVETLEEKLGDRLSKPVWISTRDAQIGKTAKEWKVLGPRLAAREAAWKSRATDPFYRSAENVAAAIEADVGRKLRRAEVDGDCFRVYIEKPYVCLVQRDKVGGEDRIADRWLETLLQLKDVFYERLGEPLALAPMEKPTPVLVLRTDIDYTKYMRLSDPRAQITSLAHYEPWSNRLVTWVEKDAAFLSKNEKGMTEEEVRTTLFHEGTHQLIDFNTKAKTPMLAMAQALWFSEGIADYFGGHGRKWNEDLQKWDYEPGLINTERIDSLTSSKERQNLIPLRELLGYRRADYVKEKEDTRMQLKILNAYAQGWLLCYLLANHNDGRDRAKFDDYVKRELSGQTGEATFKAVFGADAVERVEKDLLQLIDELGKAKKEERIVNGRLRK